jgi:uridine kinase
MSPHTPREFEPGTGSSRDRRTPGGVRSHVGPPHVIRPFLIGIAGGSGSGKTTLTHALVDTFGAERVSVLAHDAYYRDRSDLGEAERAALDFDVPEALDHERFLADLRCLRRAESVRPPRYCFRTHRRIGDGAPVEPRDIVIVEGILILHEPDVRAVFDLTIFLDAPGLLRLRRRVARDTIERGRTPASVVRQFTLSVAPAHVKYVEPTKHLADLVLSNTTRMEPLIEVAATLIRDRLARRGETSLASAERRR